MTAKRTGHRAPAAPAGAERESFDQAPAPHAPLREHAFFPVPLENPVTAWTPESLPFPVPAPDEKQQKPLQVNKTLRPGVPHYAGHRQRLRQRLFQTGPDALQDYELLELLLYTAIPRRDVKPLAKALLTEFKDLWNLLNARAERLRAFGLGESATAVLLATGSIILRAHRQSLLRKPVLSNWQRIVDYCRAAMGHDNKEQFRLLFLDRKNQLFHEEVHQRGTIDHTPVYPREVVQRALEVGAGALVLAHNHPSGDLTPSIADIDMTRAIIDACRPLGIVVHDHIIVGRESVTSFKALGLL